MGKGAFVMVALLMFLSIFVGETLGNVYKVGDGNGWTNVGTADYQKWAASKEFNVGDIILFEYNKQFHDVVRVNHLDYQTCNATYAYETFSSGNDSFVVKHPGHFFFICSRPGHCQTGQKVDIRVPLTPPPAPHPLPKPNPPTVTPLPKPASPPPGPSASEVTAPAPSPKSGGSALGSSKLWLVTLVLSAFCVYGIF